MELEERHMVACRKTGIRPTAPELDLNLDRDYRQVRNRILRESRGTDPQSTVATHGGETIPAGFMANWERAMLYFCPVRQYADVIRTASGNALPWPTVNDTGEVGALLAENTATTVEDVTTSSITLNAYKYTSKIVLVSAELLEDSAFNLAAELGSLLGERIARGEAAAFTTADGSSKPQGIIPAATTVNAADDLTISFDDIMTLIHSVDPAYRMDPSCCFMMKDSTLLYLRTLKEGTTNRYFWEDDYSGPNSGRLKGYPVVVNPAMDAIAASKKVVLFGAMRYFKIRDVAQLRLKRLVERYGEYDQEGFVAFHRTDSELLDGGTHPVKVLLTLAS
jgi:HK97 family phage major capsid protein